MRGADDLVYRRVQDREHGGWSTWTSTGGKAVGDPVTAHNLDKRPSVFVRRASGRLWHQKQAADGTWTEWGDLGTPPGTTAAGAPVVVANDNTHSDPSPNANGVVQGNTDGRLELFVRGADGRLWRRVQRAPNGTAWSNWEALGGTWAGSPAAVVTGDGRITVFARRPDGRLMLSAQKHPSTPRNPLPEDNWSVWKEIGTGYTGNVAVAAVSGEDGTKFQVFGNRSDGRLWTLAQSEPSTPGKPAGVWRTEPERLGPAVPGRPVVTSHADGRLAVFSVDAEDRVAYRTQSRAASDANPNGIWRAGWRALDKLKVSSVTVSTTPRGGLPAFDVFAVGKGTEAVHQRSRLAAGSSDGSREDVWLDWADLAPVGSGVCAGPGTLDCLTIENSTLENALSLESILSPDSYVTRSWGGSLPWQKWALRPTGDASAAVSIVSVYHEDKCIDEAGLWGALDPRHLRLADCDPQRTEQQWYIEPVLPANADKATARATDFRIRHRANPRHCLTALAEDVWPHTAARVERIACDTSSDNDHNTWKLGSGGALAHGVLAVALQQAAERCARNPDKNACTFVPLETPPAYQAAGGCVAGRVLYNDSPDRDAEYYINWSRTTGTQVSFGGSLGFSAEAFSASINASFTWIQETSTGEQVQVHVPPKEFGWVENAPVMRETIGYWKITLDGHSWTVPGRNISYAKDGTNGVLSINVAKTSKTPPHGGHCG
ncbi:hypothetical protein GL263_21890 [Streptomyces durbertensis]|uniref:PLL-like beta propeller domain-containing protein n=1 Tax=Streptomyces durbertensis TaxID=2448886 RepID=A0ABR6ELI4_9ACTN|nr:hypothetical protein [Streptomyces durbertensis]